MFTIFLNHKNITMKRNLQHLKILFLFTSLVCYTILQAQVYTFTNAGATGINGPTQFQIDSAYSSTTLSGLVTSQSGIQLWQIPYGGKYKIEVYGAGGYGIDAGKGAYMSGEFLFYTGDSLKILVGQKGGCCVGNGTNQNGGGGGSFVVGAGNTPIIIAGGGGGAIYNVGNLLTSNGNITTNGNAGVGSASGAGGTNGSGGINAGDGGGGGGFSGDGGIAPYGGKSFLNGGQGGTPTTNGGWGGFGGGGGGNSFNFGRGGGGGGYSGGGGAGSSSSIAQIGGGGGSFNSGNNQINTAGLGIGHGSVVFTLITPLAVAPYNVGATAIPSLSSGFCAGNQAVTTTIKNFGNSPIDSVFLNWEVDGVLQTGKWVVFSPSLDTIGTSGNMQTVTIGNYNFTSGSHNVKIWSSLPNNLPDTITFNDTVQFNGSTKLGGNYTLNAALPTAGTNYNSFTDLANDLNTIGVCAPVIVDVAAGSGPYNEKVVFGDIVGVSPINTIRINGNGETIQYNSTGTNDMRIIAFEGTKYFTLDSLHIKTLGTTYGWGIHFMEGAQYDSIIRCHIDLSTITGTSSTNANGIVVSGSATSPTSTGYNASNIYIGNNFIEAGPDSAAGGGYCGITIYGNSSSTGGSNNFEITNNEITNFYYYGIRTYYSDSNLISYNNIHRSSKSVVSSSSYGMYLYYNRNLRVIGNRIHDFSSSGVTYSGSFYGIYVYYSNYNFPVGNTIVANNLVYNMHTFTSTNYMLYGSYCTNTKFYHNTINANAAINSTSAFYGIYTSGSSSYIGNEVKNNIVSITGGSNGTKYGQYHSGTSFAVNGLQSNNIYINTTQTGTANWGYYNSTAYPTLAAFKTANPTLEINSIDEDPQFNNQVSGDLLPNNFNLSGIGENLFADVPTDILGNIRSLMPTPGAYELMRISGPNAAIGNITTPVDLFCANEQEIKVSIKNVGTVALSGFQIYWQVNGTIQTPVTYLGSLDTLGGLGAFSDTTILSSIVLPAGVNTIKVWVDVLGDTDRSNDTLNKTLIPTDFAISAINDTVCIGRDAYLELTPQSGYTSGMISWQSSTDGISFTDIPSSDQANWTEPNFIASKWYRVHINSGTGGCNTDSIYIYMNEPLIIDTLPSSNCGPGVVQISATASGNNNVTWFDQASGGSVLFVGDTFTTPFLLNTTTYYAESGNRVAENLPSPTIGTSEFYTSSIGWGLRFTVNESIDIDTITIKARNSSAGTATFKVTISDLNDVVLYSGVVDTFNITTTSTEYKIPVKISGIVPGNYKMGMVSTGINNLVRESGGLTFPYSSLGNEVSITAGANGIGSSQTTAAYYWFYNWQISKGCSGQRHSVTATINPIPFVGLGNDKTVCSNDSTVLNAGNAGATYLWNDSTTSQTKLVDSTRWYAVNITDANGCKAGDSIFITVNRSPILNLGNDTVLCKGNSLTLDAGNIGNTYLWDNQSITQTRSIDTTGKYFVQVTNPLNCKASDTINITLVANPIVNLGNDTAICSGDTLVLDAGAAITFEWDNTSNNQTRSVSAQGKYFVKVTDANSCVGADTINVSFVPLPSGTFTEVAGTNGSYTFTATGTGAINYKWNFGTGSNTIISGNPATHTFASSGNYTVTLILENSCGDTVQTQKQISVIKVGIEDATDTDNLIIYPNPANNTLFLNTISNPIETVQIFDMIGKLVLEQNMRDTTSIDISKLANGMYSIKAKTATQISTKTFMKQ